MAYDDQPELHADHRSGPGDRDLPRRRSPRGEHPTLVWRPKLGERAGIPARRPHTRRSAATTENDIVLAGPTVSARHATVRREAVGVVLEDEGSLNGTFVNGELVQQRLLEAGDRIQVGPHLLVFVPAGADRMRAPCGPRGSAGDAAAPSEGTGATSTTGVWSVGMR